jgi:hypothetical protein
MKLAFETPQASKIHKSLAFVLTGLLLRRLMADVSGVEQLDVGFAKFAGSHFLGMPRPDVLYYPVLAVFRLPVGNRFTTFDQYQLKSGTTALIYPVYRSRRGSIRAALLNRAIPACREWLKSRQSSSRDQKAASFYALYDQTFDELVFGPNQCNPANRRQTLRSTQKEKSLKQLETLCVSTLA